MNSISILQRYGVYILVLLAVAALVYIIISLIQSFSMEQADRKIRENRSEGMANNIYYFVGRATLQQIQLSLGILMAGGLITTMIFCQVYEPLIIVPAAALAFLIGMIAPWLYFSRKVRLRAERFENSILDLALGLTSGLKAGQALPQALEVFSRRCEGPLKEELMIVIREYRLGLELAEAMQRMYNRIPCEDLQLLIISIRLTTHSSRRQRRAPRPPRGGSSSMPGCSPMCRPSLPICLARRLLAARRRLHCHPQRHRRRRQPTSRPPTTSTRAAT